MEAVSRASFKNLLSDSTEELHRLTFLCYPKTSGSEK